MVRWFKRGNMDLYGSEDPSPRIERIRELVDELPADQRDAVSVMFFGGYSTLSDAADTLGLTEYKVKRSLHNGLETLRTLLQEEDPLGPVPADGG